MEGAFLRILTAANQLPIVSWSISNRSNVWSQDKISLDKVLSCELIVVVPPGFKRILTDQFGQFLRGEEFVVLPMIQETIVPDNPEFGVLFNLSAAMELLKSAKTLSAGQRLILCVSICFKIEGEEKWMQPGELKLIVKSCGHSVNVSSIMIIGCLTDYSTFCFKISSEEAPLVAPIELAKELEDDDVLLYLISKKADLEGSLKKCFTALKKELYV